MSDDTQSGTVLIVEDEQALAELYERFLEPSYNVRVATNGAEALERMSDAVDVVLLDRRMPGMSGEAVLENIRDGGYACRVVMVTAVTPDVDVLEMGFDEYLTKPVDRTTLLETVQTLMELADYDERLQEYYGVASKIAHLEVENPNRDLASLPKFRRLRERRDQLKKELTTADEPSSETNLRRLLERPGPHASDNTGH